MTAKTLKLKDLKLKQWNKYKQTKSIVDFNIFKIINECTINDNGIVLPAYIPKTNKSISHFLITEKQIIDIISQRNANKSQGYEHISVAILQVCPSKVAIPLQIIFQKCISSGTFPNFWKYANIQHISLLPICGKILEKIIFDNVYVFFKQ